MKPYTNPVRTMEGEEITLNIEAHGFPQPTIEWSKMGQGLVADTAVELSKDGCVTFPCVESQHEGIYHFVASNSAGTAEGDITLIVEEYQEERSSEDSANSELVGVDQLGAYVANHHKQKDAGFFMEFKV